MRNLLLALLLIAPAALVAPALAADPQFDNPLLRQRADPHVFLHRDGQYYFTATVPEYDRIEIRRTKDLNLLTRAETKVIWRKHASGPMSHHIWAPEIHFIEGKWYIYFTSSPANDIWEIRPHALVNDSADPFKGEWKEAGRIITGWESFSLDATTFVHKGKRYFSWVQRGRSPEEGQGTNIYLAEMETPLKIKGKVALLTKPDFEWEKRKYQVNEGPAVLIRNGRIFMTFSASATNSDYCVGLLTADEDADLLDPASWKKNLEPVFKTSERTAIYGPGHNSYTTTPDGKTDVFVFHGREYRDIVGHELDDPNRHTRAQVLRWKPDGTPDFGEPEADPGKVAPKPLFRDPVFDGAADPVVTYSGSFGRWYMFYTNRRATAEGTRGVEWMHGSRIGMAESLDAGVTWRYVGEADIQLPDQHGGERATHRAPDVVRDGAGTYHMFLTVVPGIFDNANHPRSIVHLSSKDLRTWRDARPVNLASDRAIDASVIRLPTGGWRMYYSSNQNDNKAIWYAESPDLETWTDRGRVAGDQPGQGSKAFRWRGKWWLVTDVSNGLAVHFSDDGVQWTRQKGNLLEVPGTGADDRVKGQNADVVVGGDRAWLFYFTQDSPGARRSSIQVVELQEQAGVVSAARDAPTRIALR